MLLWLMSSEEDYDEDVQEEYQDDEHNDEEYEGDYGNIDEENYGEVYGVDENSEMNEEVGEEEEVEEGQGEGKQNEQHYSYPGQSEESRIDELEEEVNPLEHTLVKLYLGSDYGPIGRRWGDASSFVEFRKRCKRSS